MGGASATEDNASRRSSVGPTAQVLILRRALDRLAAQQDRPAACCELGERADQSHDY